MTCSDKTSPQRRILDMRVNKDTSELVILFQIPAPTGKLLQCEAKLEQRPERSGLVPLAGEKYLGLSRLSRVK